MVFFLGGGVYWGGGGRGAQRRGKERERWGDGWGGGGAGVTGVNAKGLASSQLVSVFNPCLGLRGEGGGGGGFEDASDDSLLCRLIVLIQP